MLGGWDRLERLQLVSWGSPLRGARLIAGLSQEELAAEVGATRQTVSALERGTSIPSVSLALAIARVLGYTVEELFGDAIANGAR